MALADAGRKARFGHRDWVAYRASDGREMAAPLSREAVKAAMLAVGCSGRFYLISASTGVLNRQTWALGCLLFRNAKHLLART